MSDTPRYGARAPEPTPEPTTPREAPTAAPGQRFGTVIAYTVLTAGAAVILSAAVAAVIALWRWVL